MTIAPPPEVVSVLSLVGIDWPDSDEDKLHAMGDAWLALSEELGKLAGEVDRHAGALLSANLGVGVDAFRARWTAPNAPAATVRDGARAAALIAQGLYTASTIVTLYKLKIITEIGSLAVTAGIVVYGAFFTFGGALLATPLLRWAAKQILDELTDLAVAKVLSGDLL